MITTKGRYALRVLVDLAEHGGGWIPMKDVATRQEISLKYLERILPVLTQKHLIEGQHGKGGGYRLAQAPETIRVGDVLRLLEGDLAPVACVGEGAAPCARVSGCRTYQMWKKFGEITNAYFDGITIADLMQPVSGGEYVI